MLEKEFNTYVKIDTNIRSEDNVFQMYIETDGVWVFNGLVSETLKNKLQSDSTIESLNNQYNDQVIMSTFTGKPVETSSIKTYLFIKCEYADASLFKPSYKTKEQKKGDS